MFILLCRYHFGISSRAGILFPNLNGSICCNIFLWLCCLPQDPPAIYIMERILLASPRLRFARILPMQQYFPNH